MNKKFILILSPIIFLIIILGSYLILNNKKAEIPNCNALPDKLDACEPFKCELQHILTGEMVKREVIGLTNGKCKYKEEMPNGGEMNCEYPEDLRKAVAQYYLDIAKFKSDEAIKAEGVTYLINGKKVESPLQEALNTGVCIISGYD